MQITVKIASLRKLQEVLLKQKNPERAQNLIFVFGWWKGKFLENGMKPPDRKSVVEGKSVDLGGRRIIKKKKKDKQNIQTTTEEVHEYTAMAQRRYKLTNKIEH